MIVIMEGFLSEFLHLIKNEDDIIPSRKISEENLPNFGLAAFKPCLQRPVRNYTCIKRLSSR